MWASIATEIRKFTRVCYYDRAGYGASESGPLPRSIDRLADELHALLKEGSVPGPFILVGHSMGGLIARVYENKFPTEVSGLILVDSPHERVFESFSSALNVKLGDMFMAENKVEIPAVALAEREEVENCLKKLRKMNQLRNKPLGNKPLIVIQPGKDDLDLYRGRRGEILEKLDLSERKEFNFLLDNFAKVRETHQKELSELSFNSRPVVIAQESGHHILLMQPKVIVDEVKQVVEELKISRFVKL